MSESEFCAVTPARKEIVERFGPLMDSDPLLLG